MVRSYLPVFILLLALSISALAQKPDLEPSTGTAPVPVITFTFDFPGANPAHYSLAVESTGKAAYQSTPTSGDQAGDPYQLKFVVSDATRTRLFDLAKELNFFSGEFDYKKGKIAFTGTKTIDFNDGARHTSTSYNWSDNVALQQVTTIFQSISETLEYGRELGTLYRFDKLGVDAELRKLVDAAKNNRLLELQAIQPILKRIANDGNMMNIARKRARDLLDMIPAGAAPATASTR